MIRLLIGVAGLAIIGFFIGLWTDNLTLRLLSKPIPIFVLMYLVLHWSKTRYAVSIAVGLGFSVVGDILLEVPQNLFIQA